jgi:hypothetical protein
LGSFDAHAAKSASAHTAIRLRPTELTATIVKLPLRRVPVPSWRPQEHRCQSDRDWATTARFVLGRKSMQIALGLASRTRRAAAETLDSA